MPLIATGPRTPGATLRAAPPTEPAPVAATPGVTGVSPANGAASVAPGSAIVITFATPMDEAVTEAAFTLTLVEE